MAEKHGSDLGLKSYSCLTCRRRKIRCDRHSPCSNCTKAESQCSFVAPVRGKRKRTQPPKEGLHARLRRYEELLRSYGVNVEPSDHGGEYSDSDITPSDNVDMVHDTRVEIKDYNASTAPKEAKPRFITGDGSSRYFDSALWSSLESEAHHPEDGDDCESVDEPNDVSDVLLGTPSTHGLTPNGHSQIEHLSSLHPSVYVLPKLWDIYVDRIDPLMKILHLPTFWASLTNVVNSPRHVPKGLRAVIFAFYMTTIASLEEHECQSLFEESKSVIFTRYSVATRRALMNAGLLSTSSPDTLTAFTMFIVALRSSQSNEILFVLSGVAVRLARKMGFHRDGTSLGLSPFDSEMRRRLWWHIIYIDSRISDLLGIKPSSDIFSSDTKLPMNVEDEDLSPGMAVPPAERKGITSIVICLIKCETMEFVRNFSPSFPNDTRMENLSSSDITPAEKDNMINQLEDLLERKYLRYCDPTISLHYFASIITRSSICRMRIFAHSPHQFASQSTTIPQSERDMIFVNAIKLLQFVDSTRGNPILERYKWLMGTTYLWHAFLYVLIEAKRRKTGPEIDRMWELIGRVLSKYPQMFEGGSGAIYDTIRRWTLGVWDEYITATKAGGSAEPPTPEYIIALRSCRRASSVKSKTPIEPGPVLATSTDDICQSQSAQHNADPQTEFDPFASYDFSDLLSFEVDSNEWMRWG